MGSISGILYRVNLSMFACGIMSSTHSTCLCYFGFRDFCSFGQTSFCMANASNLLVAQDIYLVSAVHRCRYGVLCHYRWELHQILVLAYFIHIHFDDSSVRSVQATLVVGMGCSGSGVGYRLLFVSCLYCQRSLMEISWGYGWRYHWLRTLAAL